MPPRKPAGGITAVELIPPGAAAVVVPLVEDRSSYTEEACSDDGILRIHHTLRLVLPRAEVAPLLPLLPRLVWEGVTARVTTAAGEELLAGWSELFGYEQPLRLSTFTLSTGTRPAEGNHAVLCLESDDRTALQETETLLHT